MIQARDTQHGPLRDRDPADQLWLPLVLDLGRPAKFGHLEPQRVHLTGPLVTVGIRPDLEPVQRLLQFVCHAPIQSVIEDVPARCPRGPCGGRGGGRIAWRPLSTRYRVASIK